MARKEDDFTVRRAGGFEGGEDHEADEECRHYGIQVFHVWETDTDDSGMVEVFVYGDGDEDACSIRLEPAEALVVAEHIRRAAIWALERFEDAPDFEREASKWAVADAV